MWDDILAYRHDIAGGVLASFVYAILTWLIALNKSYLLRRTIFPGIGVIHGQPFYIVYAQFVLDAPVSGFDYVKVDNSGHRGGYKVSISTPVSKCEVRAATYLTAMLSQIGKIKPILASDNDTDSEKDLSVIAIGGLPNLRTTEIFQQLDSERQTLLAEFFGKQRIPGHTLTGDYDYGVIVRLTPPGNPTKPKIICAGLAEWGSSGSSRYLAYHWADIARSLRGRFANFLPLSIPDYLAFVRVRPGDDSSAVVLDLYSFGKVKRLVRIASKKNW